MKKNIVMIILLCPISILLSNYEDQDNNIGHLYPEEREALVQQEKLTEVLGEVAIKLDALEAIPSLTRDIDQKYFQE